MYLDILQLATSDLIWFYFIQLTLVLITIVACVYDHLPDSSPVSGLIRGESSRSFFQKAAGILVTIILFSIFQISNIPEDGRILLYLFDLILVGYLFFFSGWFTNRLARMRVIFEEQDMSPRGSRIKYRTDDGR